MFMLQNGTSIRLYNKETGDTEKLLTGELNVIRGDDSCTIDLSNCVEIENDTLNIYEAEKKIKMDKLQELLEQNNHYYVNKYCFGYYYGLKEVKSYRCDQCGDWNGSEGEGTFRELLLGDVIGQLEYSLTYTIEDLGMQDLFEIDEFDYYILKDESEMNHMIDELMKYDGLYENNIYLTVEHDELILSMKEIPTDILKEALIQLMTKSEE